MPPSPELDSIQFVQHDFISYQNSHLNQSGTTCLCPGRAGPAKAQPTSAALPCMTSKPLRLVSRTQVTRCRGLAANQTPLPLSKAFEAREPF